MQDSVTQCTKTVEWEKVSIVRELSKLKPRFHSSFGTNFFNDLLRSSSPSWIAWPLKTGPISSAKRRWRTNNLRCVTSQKSYDLIYVATEVWNHAKPSSFYSHTQICLTVEGPRRQRRTAAWSRPDFVPVDTNHSKLNWTTDTTC
jgi:hypothetical protein